MLPHHRIYSPRCWKKILPHHQYNPVCHLRKKRNIIYKKYNMLLHHQIYNPTCGRKIPFLRKLQVQLVCTEANLATSLNVEMLPYPIVQFQSCRQV